MKYQVEELLPHEAPMILVDRLVDYNDDEAFAELDIDENHLFYQEGEVPAWVGIEFMAQTIGAFIGVEQREKGEDITVGFLVGTRRYDAHVAGFATGTLQVHIKRILQEAELGVFDCTILSQGQVLANAKLNTFKPLNPDQYFAGVQRG